MVNLLNFLNTSFYLNPVTPTKPLVKFKFLKKKQNLVKRLKKLKSDSYTGQYYGHFGFSNTVLTNNLVARFNSFKVKTAALINAKKSTSLTPQIKQKLFLTYLSLNYGTRQTSFGVEQLLQSSLNENFPFYKNFDIVDQFYYFYEIPIPDDLENQSFAVQRFFNTLPFNKIKYTPFVVSEQNHKFFKPYYKDNFIKNFNKKLFSSYNTLIHFSNFISGLYFFKKKMMFLEYRGLLSEFENLIYFNEDDSIFYPFEMDYDFRYHNKADDDDIISHALEGEVLLKNLYLLPKKLKSVKKDNYFAKLDLIKKDVFNPSYYKSYFLGKFKLLKSRKQLKFRTKFRNFQTRLKRLIPFSKTKQKLNLSKVLNLKNFNPLLTQKVGSVVSKFFTLDQIFQPLMIRTKVTNDFVGHLQELLETHAFYQFCFDYAGMKAVHYLSVDENNKTIVQSKLLPKVVVNFEHSLDGDLKLNYSEHNFLAEQYLIMFDLKKKISLIKDRRKNFLKLASYKKLLADTRIAIEQFLSAELQAGNYSEITESVLDLFKVEKVDELTIKLPLTKKRSYIDLFKAINLKSKPLKYIFLKQLEARISNSLYLKNSLVKPKRYKMVPNLVFQFVKVTPQLKKLKKILKYVDEDKLSNLDPKFYSVRFYKNLNYLSKFNQFDLSNYNNLLFDSYFSKLFGTSFISDITTKLNKYYFRNKSRFFKFANQFKLYLADVLTPELANEVIQKDNFFYLIKKSLQKFINLYGFSVRDPVNNLFVVKNPKRSISLFSNFKKSKIYFSDYFNVPLLSNNINIKTKEIISNDDKYLFYDLQNVLDKLEFFNEGYLKLIFTKGSNLPFNKSKVIAFVEKKMIKLDFYYHYFNKKQFYFDKNFKKIMVQFRYLFKLYRTLYNFTVSKPYTFSFVRKLIILSRRLKKKSYFNKLKYYKFISTCVKLIQTMIKSKMFIKHTFFNYLQSYYFLKMNTLIDETLLYKRGTFELDESKLSDRQYVLDNAEDILLTLNDVYHIVKQTPILEWVPSPLVYDEALFKL